MKNSTKTALALGISAAFAAPLAGAAIVSVDVTGIESWDAAGSPNNTVLSVDLAAELGLAPGSSVTIDGIGWDVVISSVGASWLSEMDVNIAVGNPDAITLGVSGTTGPGTGEANSSSGIVTLADVPLNDIVLSDGILVLEFFESYDDAADSIDGIWDSGFIDFRAEATVVPIPAAFPLLLTGLAGLFAARRRRVS
ncbi:MAG: VPLPA-CTERM sorting domain-containing protein [Gammaproteobacteria bacterium]|nr:VPLPA-CTERM sorting domain-containing protein [Gammaproteobacteria bacterium]